MPLSLPSSATKFIFVTGGVVSSLGKGIAASALAALLQARGYKVKLRKLDPYLNVDPGTMNPYEHGEVFVTYDGAEADLDLGHYERFTGVRSSKEDSITTGKIYLNLLSEERKGRYLGATVQVIPHITDLIKQFIVFDAAKYDFIICEIGGTVGDIEGLPYFEAIRQLGYALGAQQSVFIHVTLVPYIAAAKELKTKPTQHSVKELRSIGIQPDIILCRSDHPISANEKRKVALFCNIEENCVISALDQDNIYKIPLAYHKERLDSEVLRLLGINHEDSPNLEVWHNIVDSLEKSKAKVRIAVIGKYSKFKDAYKSLIQAFEHSGIQHSCQVELIWVNAEDLTANNVETKLDALHISGILVPGGFGSRGIEGKIEAISYARTKKIPFFGICLGMQLAVIEFARNVLQINDAISSEFSETGNHIISLMDSWTGRSSESQSNKDNLGGTMRLGHYPCRITPDSLAASIYEGAREIQERHRHRYEFNPAYHENFRGKSLKFSGVSPDEKLLEIVELDHAVHPFFIATQFHPEFESNPMKAHPLFIHFVAAARKYSDTVKQDKQ